MSPFTEQERMEARDHKLEDLLRAVREASAAYEFARSAEDVARRECTAALNALNAAQRLVDVALSEVRRIAPNASDWRQYGERVTGAGQEPAPQGEKP